MFFWWSGFSVLCGFGLCIGYTLLGACWLAGKVSVKVDVTAFRCIPWLMLAVSGFIATAFAISVYTHLQVMDRWSTRPYLAVFPLIALIGLACLLHGVHKRVSRLLFRAASLVFVAAFATLAASFWPYMIPFAVTIDAAAAPPSSLRFLFWGIGVFVFPLTLVYTGVVYRIFRGPVQGGYRDH
jgi:cytochrome d ubiquinol oxidase subunit II